MLKQLLIVAAVGVCAFVAYNWYKARHATPVAVNDTLPALVVTTTNVVPGEKIS